ncbi:MAG: hypothetical protein H8D23_25595 [Candidatus Brocadiales bacterium]|nr:hypothetical protein [Candidatus Brocadiales bacterium]
MTILLQEFSPKGNIPEQEAIREDHRQLLEKLFFLIVEYKVEVTSKKMAQAYDSLLFIIWFILSDDTDMPQSNLGKFGVDIGIDNIDCRQSLVTACTLVIVRQDHDVTEEAARRRVNRMLITLMQHLKKMVS